MRPEKERLIADLFDPGHASARDAILLESGRILRRKKVRRVTLRIGGAIAVVGLAAMPLLRGPRFENPGKVNVSSTGQVPVQNQPKALTDKELLALFPDTPVALASSENGRKRLIFPRPGDEERFVTKM
jgi:hypothetical protein